MQQFGPRQRELLDAWRKTVSDSAAGNHYDFTAPTPTDELQDRMAAFLEDPSEETFTTIWSSDIIRSATYGGSKAVLNNWEGDFEDLVDYFDIIQQAETYDQSWEAWAPDFIIPGLWELYGRLHPERSYILNNWVRKALPLFGLDHPQTYAEGVEQLEQFQEIYEQQVGHVTAGTQHEVPLADEIEQFLYLVVSLDESELRETLNMDAPTHETFAGWDAMQSHGNTIELSGLTQVLDAFTTASNSDAYEQGKPEHWGASHWETWKDDYRAYLESDVFPEYDPTALTADDVEPFIENLSVAEPLSTVTPIYLLGGRWQPWENFKEISIGKPREAAKVLSKLLDEESGVITDRLRQFNNFYHEVSDSGGERMALATMLLMLTHPDTYVMYRYSMFNDFFSAFSEYNVPTGYHPSAYVLMNDALYRVRDDLDRHVADSVRMLDIHTLLWLYHRQGPP